MRVNHEAIPQPVLAEFAAAYAALQRLRRDGAGASVTLRLSVDRAGVARLEAERWDGISAQALVGDVESQRGKA